MRANPLSAPSVRQVSRSLQKNATSQQLPSVLDFARAFCRTARVLPVSRKEAKPRYIRCPVSARKSAPAYARSLQPLGTRLDVRLAAAVVPALCPQFRPPRLAPEHKEC